MSKLFENYKVKKLQKKFKKSDAIQYYSTIIEVCTEQIDQAKKEILKLKLEDNHAKE